MDVDGPVPAALPDLTLADRRFLLTLPETDNKAELVQEIKDAILKDSTLFALSIEGRSRRSLF